MNKQSLGIALLFTALGSAFSATAQADQNTRVIGDNMLMEEVGTYINKATFGIELDTIVKYYDYNLQEVCRFRIEEDDVQPDCKNFDDYSSNGQAYIQKLKAQHFPNK